MLKIWSKVYLITLRAWRKICIFGEKNIRFDTALNLFKCFNIYQIMLLTCAPVSELPSSISTMHRPLIHCWRDTFPAFRSSLTIKQTNKVVQRASGSNIVLLRDAFEAFLESVLQLKFRHCQILQKIYLNSSCRIYCLCICYFDTL